MNPITKLRLSKQPPLTRGDLSRRSNVSYAGLSNLESGLPLSMSSKTAEKLARYCGVNPDELQQAYAEWRNSLTCFDN